MSPVPAFHVEAKLHAFRKTADGIVVSFVVSPIDLPPALALDPLGTRYMLALCAISDDETPVPQQAPAAPNQRSETGRQRYLESDEGERAVTRAALLPQNKPFRNWAAAESNERAAAFIRSWCKIDSRSELATDDAALARFLKMEMQYLADTGQMAEVR